MPITRTRTIKLSKWFPSNNPLATKIARLCILREDFLLEMEGVFAEKIEALDGHSDEWRKLYFLRKLIGTLREIESGIQRLLSDDRFKTLLAAENESVQEHFSEHAALMNKGIAVVKEVRDDICFHVPEGAIERTLTEISNSDVFGLLELSPVMRHTHFKFVGELVLQILVRDVPEANKHAHFEEKIDKICMLFPAWSLIEYAFDIYIKDRGLLG